MPTRIDSGGSTAPIPQNDPSVGKQEDIKSSVPAQSQVPDSADNVKAAQSNATDRAAETSITSRVLASQLQSQLATAPVGGSAAAEKAKPLLFEGGNNSPADVKNMQQQLNEVRARNGQEPLKEDGIFGPKTKAAVKEFQESEGLKNDGIIGPNTRDRLTLENNSNFQKLNPDVQAETRNQMNDAQNDPIRRQNVLSLATDDNFAKLSVSEQKTLLLKNDDFLKLAESPGGKAQLDSLKTSLQNGPQTPETLKQLERINSATFTPVGGLKLQGTPEDQAKYLHMVRRDMMSSPSFAKTMNEIDGDKAHPVTVNIGRDMTGPEAGRGVRLDTDRGKGVQDIDLADFEKLPESPTAKNPNGITQGEVLSHAMREARERALDPDSTKPEPDQHLKAHTAAIKDENEFRKDIGQKTSRRLPPNDEKAVPNNQGDITLIIFFDGPPQQENLVFDKDQKLQR